MTDALLDLIKRTLFRHFTGRMFTVREMASKIRILLESDQADTRELITDDQILESVANVLQLSDDRGPLFYQTIETQSSYFHRDLPDRDPGPIPAEDFDRILLQYADYHSDSDPELAEAIVERVQRRREQRQQQRKNTLQ